MSDDAERRVISGESWRRFCRQLEAAGEPIFANEHATDALSRAEGTRYLTRLVRAALETFVEFADPMAPVLRRTVHETIKMGADNPDNWYENAPVHGDYEYRLYGSRGTVPYLSIATQVGHYGQGAGMPPAGFLEAKDLKIGADGTLELILSRRQQAGNWLPLADGYGTLIIRQTFLDRAREQRAELTLERIGGPLWPAPLTAEAMDAGLASAGSLVAACAMIFPGWADGFRAHANTLPRFDPDLSRMFGGDPNIAYYHSYWELKDDEALVIETTPPPCEYWNFQLNNYWMESLDYRHHRVCINKAGARLRSDGSVRIVVAHRDPGVENWVDTAGHRFGTMCLRWVRAAEHPQPQTRVVQLSDLRP
ncbi:MAG TPA: DUF1214 domain-containing protein [Candidatus Limnocylindrales bacterium]|nr:DUF1214 domain-containing protein [Candidatus Limnocylindrales bacterium]